MSEYYVHPSSVVDEGVTIGEGTRIWHFCHIQKGAVIGKRCSLGQNVNVSNNVTIGDGCKLQNNVSVYEGVELEDYVFCGPSCVFTNDLTPRAKYPKGAAGYKKTLIREGASIGANATVVCGHTVGRWALIGAGAVVRLGVRMRRAFEGWTYLPQMRPEIPRGRKRTYGGKGLMQFRDLQKQYEVLKPEMDAAMTAVASGAHFISGEQVAALEERLAAYVGRKHCITCGNGTDALELCMMAWGIGPGDAVFVPDFTFFASGEVVSSVGGTPVFYDVCADTFNADAKSLEAAIEAVIAEGRLLPKAVVDVDLFGLPADREAVAAVCEKYGLLFLEDAAQGFGGMLHGKRNGAFGDAACTSFFPAKPLGCYGDGGAVFTDSDGKGSFKYDNVRIGMNSRLDTIQAAILLVKMDAFEKYELSDVNAAAAMYDEELAGIPAVLPVVPEGWYSSWAQYTLRLRSRSERDRVQSELKAQGIPTMVYYPKPMHTQQAFAGLKQYVPCPVTEELCATVLSIPMHPYLTRETVQTVADALRRALK